MLEGQGGEHFQAEVGREEIFELEGRLHIAADVGLQRAAGQCAVVGLGVDRVGADLEHPVARLFGVGAGGQGEQGGGE